jgi:hypothetical protein
VKMLAHLHMIVYTWWCWHICRGEVAVELDQLEEKKELRQGDRTLVLNGTGPCLGRSGTKPWVRSAQQSGIDSVSGSN